MFVERVPCSQIADKGLTASSVSFRPQRIRDDGATAISSFSRPGSNRTPTPQPSRFLARQPILDARRKAIGYELLFRSGWENCFRGDRDAATRQTLDNCLAMDIESLAGSGLAFVNCTHQALVDKLVTLLPPRTTVIEILETVAPDPELIQACIELRELGYKLALDDFVPRPELQPLVDIASYIKVDLRISDAAMRREIQKMTGGSRAVLLAEKVENQEDFDTALGEGYKYFQGYFFCRPAIVARREIPPNRANYLRLLVELTRSPFNLSEVARIVELEPSLCYRLLRLANSALWSMRNDITSIRNAIMLVGEDRFRILVSVAASCVLGQNRRSALVSLSLERARFCELVAPLVGENPTEQFMLGLLSLMDALLETPMDSIAKSLPLRGPAKAALLGESNPVAVPLCLTRSFESAAWGTRESTPNDSGVSEETLAHLYMQSVKWASDAVALC
jgi:EAL and modified HD-GYP domain-containing signal transduction protein